MAVNQHERNNSPLYAPRSVTRHQSFYRGFFSAHETFIFYFDGSGGRARNRGNSSVCFSGIYGFKSIYQTIDYAYSSANADNACNRDCSVLILWMGYGLAPKITLVFLTCFFPVTIGLLGAFSSADNDALRLLQSMGAKKWQLYRYIKIPQSLPAFFSGLKIAASYSIIGAVVAEWLGGDAGLGVYMIRVRRSYSFDKMFAVIILVSALSLLLIKLVTLIEKKSMPWRKK